MEEWYKMEIYMEIMYLVQRMYLPNPSTMSRM